MGNARQGYLLIAIFMELSVVCHIFCFAKTKEVVEVPVAQKIPLRLQLQAVAKNKPLFVGVVGTGAVWIYPLRAERRFTPYYFT